MTDHSPRFLLRNGKLDVLGDRCSFETAQPKFLLRTYKGNGSMQKICMLWMSVSNFISYIILRFGSIFEA